MHKQGSSELAKKVRKLAVQMTNKSGASHIGPILSIVDIVCVLYNDVMHCNPDDPGNVKRDRFILSKGHAGVAVYATLAEMGYFEKALLDCYYQNGSKLSGHISHIEVPGVEFSTGSLGHGVCVAAGMAFSARFNQQNHRIFCLIGDGECQEGSVWEMAMFSVHYRLSNFTVIIDHNKLQSLDTLENTMSIRNLPERWRVFGWDVEEVDGHDHKSLEQALVKSTGKPRCIIANTVKGKGVSFMENQILWHYRDPQGEFFDKAMAELNDTNEKDDNK